MQLNSIEELIEDIRQGKMVILMDDEDRENEGDLVLAAELVRPEDINFMATHARGLICLTLTGERCQQLDLPLMVAGNHSSQGTNFTVSIEAAEGVTTGISAADRARTVRAAVARNAVPRDIVQPGHVFPLRAQKAGVLSRAGHTEAGCDLARLAGFEPSAVIVEIMNEDGSMARRQDLETFAKRHDLKIGTIADLIHYRVLNEKTVICENEHEVETRYGKFTLKIYRDTVREEKHFVLVKGTIDPDQPILVRVHLSNSARDVLSLQPSQGHKLWSIHAALEKVAKEGRGVIVLIYFPETAEEIETIINEMLEDQQHPSSRASRIVYQQIGTGSQILRDLGVHKMRLMSAPLKFRAISGFDLEVVEYVEPD